MLGMVLEGSYLEFGCFSVNMFELGYVFCISG